MILLDLSKGFWVALAEYLSCFSTAEIFAIVFFCAIEFFFIARIVGRDRKKDAQ